tara:strand:+ start:306 stop:1118 length:813 start_codon:yes stop_codon:yes gene_type:complete
MIFRQLFLAIILSLIFLFPLYLVFINSFKFETDILNNPASFPELFTFNNYSNIFLKSNELLINSFFNSFLFTSLSIIFVLILSSMLAFSIHFLNKKIQTFIFVFLLLGLILPTPIILIPVFTILKFINLNNTFLGLILFFSAYYLPFGTLVFRGFMKNIPREMIEASFIDGANFFVCYYKIILPILQPAAASVIIITGTWVWNDFLNPLILLGPLQGTTVTVGLYRMVGQYSINFGELYAFMVLISLPVLVAYLFLQKYFIEGLLAGSSK